MGSKRTGPDLMRVGGKYNHNWHFNHMWSPQATSTGSIMPAYKWLFDNKAMNHDDVQKKMAVMAKLGVPYSQQDIDGAFSIAKQSAEIEEGLKGDPKFVKAFTKQVKKS